MCGCVPCWLSAWRAAIGLARASSAKPTQKSTTSQSMPLKLFEWHRWPGCAGVFACEELAVFDLSTRTQAGCGAISGFLLDVLVHTNLLQWSRVKPIDVVSQALEALLKCLLVMFRHLLPACTVLCGCLLPPLVARQTRPSPSPFDSTAPAPLVPIAGTSFFLRAFRTHDGDAWG